MTAKVLPFPSKGKPLVAAAEKKPTATAGHKPVVAVVSDIESLVPRDQWDRPKIIQPDGTLVSYRRASSVAEAIDGHIGLDNWHCKLTALGLAARPDLMQAVQVAKNNKELTAIINEAQVHAGRDVASNNGSYMHRLTDLIDTGKDIPSGLPVHVEAMLEKYAEATADLEVLDSERFVVQDELRIAGTYDRRVRSRKTGRVLIGDLKTGQKLAYQATKTPAQVAAYAKGVWYDLDGDREPHGAEEDWGLLIHLPWTIDPREAECEVYWLDLRIGRAAIKEAFGIEAFRKIKHTQTMIPYGDGTRKGV
jgi:hypothetical protein